MLYGTYTVKITLITEKGDPPNGREVEDLVMAQMDGELDDPVCNGGTGLFCSGVTVVDADYGVALNGHSDREDNDR